MKFGGYGLGFVVCYGFEISQNLVKEMRMPLLKWIYDNETLEVLIC
ncbi:hypothetical protein [Helicobacter pullorum]|nr:hypothetical protein [Helicobacter pullorum]